MSVSVRIACAKCGVEYVVRGLDSGSAVACWKCGAEMLVPAEGDGGGTGLGNATLAGSPDDPHVTLADASGPTAMLPGRAGGDSEAAEVLLRDLDPAPARYVEQLVIARGGMGEVVLCLDRDIRRQVAMKRMLATTASDPSRRARFIEEAQVTGQLEHPNIVPVYELVRDPDGTVCYTMRLVAGKSLAELLRAAKEGKEAPSLGELLQVFLKACDAVAYAHARGVIHRDLKPGNIMVGDFGEVLVMDWGLAKVVGREDTHVADLVATVRAGNAETRTMDGFVLGTPAYMAPEQLEGDLAQVGERSDVYSLGAVLYNILTLQPTHAADTEWIVSPDPRKWLIEPPRRRAPGRHIRRELSAIAMKCLAKDPQARYPSVADLQHDLVLFLEGRSVSASPDTFSQAAAKFLKRNKGASIAVAAAALVLAAVTMTFTARLAGERERALAGERLIVAERKAAQEVRERLLLACAEAATAGFHDAIRGLPPEEQQRRIAAKLSEIHGVDIAPSFTVQNGAIVGVSVASQPVRFLHPLKGLPLIQLDCANAEVRDLGPLRGMLLRKLAIEGCGDLTDLSPLAGVPLEALSFTPKHITKGIEAVRAMSSIQKIGLQWEKWMDPREFWEKCDAGEFSK